LPLLFWDASALAKRYVAEVGTDTVNALFASVPVRQMVGTLLGFAETYSTLIRRYNRGSISISTFMTGKTSLRTEVVDDPDFSLLTVDDAAIFDSLALMDQYNLNATDAAILALYLRYIQSLSAGSPVCLLVAADQRLLTAGQGEGLQTLNPESITASAVPAFLASL
jgi:uncharacterized protein